MGSWTNLNTCWIPKSNSHQFAPNCIMTLPSLATPGEASAAACWSDFTRPWNHFKIERPTCFISKTVTNMSIAFCFNCMWWFPTCPEVQTISKCRTFSTNMKTKHEIVSVCQEHFKLLCGKKSLGHGNIKKQIKLAVFTFTGYPSQKSSSFYLSPLFWSFQIPVLLNGHPPPN